MAKHNKEEQETQAPNNGATATGQVESNDSAAGVDGADLSNASSEQLQQLLEQEQSKSKEYLDAFQRSRADFLNLKRRTDQERGTLSAEAKEKLILRLLPIVDDFERALANLPENLKGEAWVNGVGLIEKKLKNLLDQENVTEIPAQDTEFNPHLHQAVHHDENAEGEKDWVTAVYQKGYKLGDKIIRPAMVEVGRK